METVIQNLRDELIRERKRCENYEKAISTLLEPLPLSCPKHCPNGNEVCEGCKIAEIIETDSTLSELMLKRTG